MKVKVKSIIKIGIELPYYCCVILLLLIKPNNNVNLLLGTPLHENLGDHLIVYSEKLFLSEMCGIKKIVEIPLEVYFIFEKLISKIKIGQNSNVFITGGGWMGNIWSRDEYMLQRMVKTFDDKKIFILPQSIYYDEKQKNCSLVKKDSIAALSNRDNLVVCTRDYKSYNIAKEMYHNTKVLLVPDMALYLHDKNLVAKKKREYVGVCIRADREKKKNIDIRKIILKYKLPDLAIKNISTCKKYYIPSFLRVRCVKKIISDYASCKYIITDRLHGMILSFLTGTKCIVFDNKTGKIIELYKAWLCNCSEIIIDKNELNFNKNICKNIDEGFEELRKVICNGKN